MHNNFCFISFLTNLSFLINHVKKIIEKLLFKIFLFTNELYIIHRCYLSVKKNNSFCSISKIIVLPILIIFHEPKVSWHNWKNYWKWSNAYNYVLLAHLYYEVISIERQMMGLHISKIWNNQFIHIKAMVNNNKIMYSLSL